MNKEERKGEVYIIMETFLWSFFPILTILSAVSVPPILNAGISTLFAALFFVIWITKRHEWYMLKNTVWREILLSTLLIGVLYFSFIFVGITYTTAGTAAILTLAGPFFSFIFINVLLGAEQNTARQYFGAAILVLGAVIVLFPEEGMVLNRGSLLIIIATTLAPFGNFFAKRATKVVSPHFLMMARSIIAGIFLVILGLFIEGLAIEFSWYALLYMLINGVILFGVSKVFWFEAIRHITIAKANTMSSSGVVLTLIFAYFILGEIPTYTQIIGVMPIIIGLYLITHKNNKPHISQKL